MGVARARTGKVFSKPSSRKRTPLQKARGDELVWAQVAPVLEAGQEFADVCYLYFVGEEDEGPLKIGTAKDPVGRLRDLQVGNPRRLKIEYLLFGDVVLEKLMHQFWEDYAIFSVRTRKRVDAAPNTEWFKSEVRTALFPILKTAVELQLHAVENYRFTAEWAEEYVRRAHITHGFIAKGRDEVRLARNAAGGGGGTITSRRSRI